MNFFFPSCCSEFADIFDLEHFKSVLANDVHVVSALPSTHLMTRPIEGSPPPHVTPTWIRSRYLKRVRIYCFSSYRNDTNIEMTN